MRYALLPVVVTFAMVLSHDTFAAEVTLIAPGGIRAAIFGSGGGTKERVLKGDPFDVPIVQPPLDPVLASGQVVVASETALATVAVGIAVRSGAP